MPRLIQLRRGIASLWTSVNPTLAAGEPGVEVDTHRLKIGDGATPWATLPPVTALRTVTLADAATVAINADTTDIGTLTATASRTIGTPSGSPRNGQPLELQITAGGAGGWSHTWSSAYVFPTSTPAPTWTATAGKVDIIGFRYRSATSKWICMGYVLGS